MHSPFPGPIPDVEIGWPICVNGSGRVAPNVPQVSGTPMAVNVPITCPSGTRYRGITHSHPKGVPYPSDQDIKSAIASGGDILCIRNDKEQKCFQVGR